MRASSAKALVDQCVRIAIQTHDRHPNNNFVLADLDHIIAILQSISRELTTWDSELYVEIAGDEMRRITYPAHLKSDLIRDLEEIRGLVKSGETDRILPILDAVIGLLITQSDLERYEADHES